jgi:hypothetical protein
VPGILWVHTISILIAKKDPTTWNMKRLDSCVEES